MKRLTILCGVLLLMSSCHALQALKEDKMDISNKEKAVALLHCFETGDPEPVGYVNPNKLNILDKTDANKALVEGFVRDVLKGANPGRITEYISADQYLQHNPAVADGLDALGKALEAMAGAGKPMVYTENHMILGEGNFVLSVSEGQFLGKHAAFYDLFRIENGRIVEHWDAIEQISPKDKWMIANEKF